MAHSDKSTGKIMICRCEDVTLADVEHAIDRGFADIEEVKRYTGFGTGPCQGKECLALVARVILERTGHAPSAVSAFTSRPPLSPTPLVELAGAAELFGSGQAEGHHGANGAAGHGASHAVSGAGHDAGGKQS